MRKKIDDKIKILLENGINTNERVMFLIVGDRGRDQISNIHNFHSMLNPGKKLNILWCYKKELGFSSHAKKKMNKIKKLQNKGLYDPNEENAFELFISSTDIKFCFYHDTQRILGNTFGMLILQDFEAITPNLLCRAIETVQGGGVIIFLLNNMTSLKQLYTLTMDVHDRYRTDAKEVEPRFNERFMLSLSTCPNVLVVDDELNILPITSGSSMKSVQKEVDLSQSNAFMGQREKELKELISNADDLNKSLYALCRTKDQAKCVMDLVDTISEGRDNVTVSITAGRGRGKSSSLGLAVASAVVYGLSNIFVTAPTVENLKTFFEFVIKGLQAAGYKEHKDYEVQLGTNENLKNSIVKINIKNKHKQSISYVSPTDFNIFALAELIVIDEAAAIPLHLVKRIMSKFNKILISFILFI